MNYFDSRVKIVSPVIRTYISQRLKARLARYPWALLDAQHRCYYIEGDERIVGSDVSRGNWNRGELARIVVAFPRPVENFSQ